MTTYPAMQPLIDRGALHALLLQEVLQAATDALGEYRWDADMQEKKLWFISKADESNRITADVDLVASIAPGPRSILWGWAHPMGGPDGAAAQLKAVGERDGIAELTSAELAFPDDFDEQDADGVAGLAHDIGIMSVGALGRGPYFTAPIGGGSRVVLQLKMDLPPITLSEAATKLSRILSTGLLRDARTSIWGLAVARGWQFEWADNFASARVSDGPSTATFSFDELGRVTNIAGSLSAAAE